MSADDEDGKPLDSFPVLDALPAAEEEKEEPSFMRKLDIKFDDDCKTCKFIGAFVCYGSGVLVWSTIKHIPVSKLPARFMTGLFGVGLFAVGTLRLFVPGNDINAPLFGNRSENQSDKAMAWIAKCMDKENKKIKTAIDRNQDAKKRRKDTSDSTDSKKGGTDESLYN